MISEANKASNTETDGDDEAESEECANETGGDDDDEADETSTATTEEGSAQTGDIVEE